MSGESRDMSDAEWDVLRLILPRKHQGPERLHDRRVMDGIYFVLRTGAPVRRGRLKSGRAAAGGRRRSIWAFTAKRW